MKKLLASDYDETIKINHNINKEDIESISKWKEDNYFAIISGRSINTLIEEIKKYNIPFDYISSNNGGILLDSNLNVLYKKLIDYDKALDIIEYIETLDIISYVVNDGFNRAYKRLNNDLEDIKYGSISNTIDMNIMLNNKEISQIVLSVNSDDTLYYAKVLNSKYSDYICAFANKNCIDIVPVDVNKAYAVAVIKDLLDINSDNVFTLGDSYNDISMLDKYNGYAIDNCSKEVLNYVNGVFSCINELIKFLNK